MLVTDFQPQKCSQNARQAFSAAKMLANMRNG
jgi:hypothetical protein